MPPSPSPKWIKPQFGRLKLNFDGVWRARPNAGNCDWLIRDSTGNFIAGGAKGGSFRFAQEDEANALHQGLTFIKQKKLENVVCEGDAQEIIKQMAAGKPDDDLRTDTILWNCVNLSKNGKSLSFVWVPRVNNCSAHHIAFWAYHANITDPWNGTPLHLG